MKVKDIINLLGRFDRNAVIDGCDLAVLRVKHSGHLVLVPEREKAGLLELAPHYYEDPTL